MDKIRNILSYILCFFIPISFILYLDTKFKIITSIFTFLISAFILYQNKKLKLKTNTFTYIFSILFSTINVLGKYVYIYNDLFIAFKGFNILKVIIEIIGISYFIKNLFNYLFYYLIKYINAKHSPKYKFFQNKYLFFILWLILFISWIPCFLAYYPGIFSYDMQLQTAFIYIRPSIFSKFHPPLHTYFWQFCLFLSNYIKLEAIAIYSLIQMIIMSAIISKLISFITKRTNNNWLIILTICFFTINPLIPIIMLLPTKDIFFSGMLILFVLEIFNYLENKDLYFKKRFNYLKLIIITTLTCLLRNNAVYVLSIFFIIFCLSNKKKFLEILCVFICSLAIYEFIDNCIYVSLGIAEGKEREKMTVLLQQISFVDYIHHDELIEKEIEMIDKFWYKDEDNKEYFNYRFGDLAKYYFSEAKYKENKKDFWKLYFSLFKKYPKDYTNAFLTLNIQNWYIDAQVIDPYSNRKYIEDEVLDSYHYTIERKSKSPALLTFYENIANYSYLEKIPIIKNLTSISFPIWFLLFTILVCVIKKTYEKILTTLPLLLLWLTYLLGPVSIFRYMIPLFLLYPLFLYIIFDKERNKKNEKKG